MSQLERALAIALAAGVLFAAACGSNEGRPPAEPMTTWTVEDASSVPHALEECLATARTHEEKQRCVFGQP